MGQQVDVAVWGQVALAPGAEITLIHYWTFDNGTSVFDPDHWYWMSAMPDYDPYQRPDRPVHAVAVEATAQRGNQPGAAEAGLDNLEYWVTWRNPGQDGIAYFRPKVIQAPSKF
ncbi:MAG: hypothetical protein GIW99_07435 [Candidatus Eremiobacteraeota bacterium]|nr:hypothetical protein [Candidatus Eremiobacteraeota bacterium]MBC5827496.1 hypothetical protein [Candidatus Eremiobacteraeota bacterium]